MSPTVKKIVPLPFIADQRLSLLDAGVDPWPLLDVPAFRERRDHGGYVEEEQDSPWKPLSRDDLTRGVAETGRLCRTLVVADAGLGKTTLAEGLQADLCQRYPQIMTLRLLVDQLPASLDDLPRILVERCFRSVPGCGTESLPLEDAERLLRRLRKAGRLCLILDSIDQSDQSAEAGKPMATLRRLTTDADWQACPMVVTTRPHALAARRSELFPEPRDWAGWRFVRPELFDQGQQRRFLGKTDDGADRYDLIPKEGRQLLGVPRVLELLRNLGDDKQSYEGLTTMAAVYVRCMEELLLAGMACREAAPAEEKAKWPLRRDAAMELLGALAMEMFVHAPDEGQPPPGTRPNLSHVPAAESLPFLSRVWGRLADALDEHKAAKRRTWMTGLSSLGLDDFDSFYSHFLEICATNAGPLDNFLLDAAGRHQDIRWRNPTTQAFFAAWWLVRHGGADDFARLSGWLVDGRDDDQTRDYAEFWRFATEMPREKSRPAAYEAAMAPLYAPGSPVRATEFLYRSWGRMAGTAAQAAFLREFPDICDGQQGPAKQAVATRFLAGFQDLVGSGLPGDDGKFVMGATAGEVGAYPDEAPVEVILSPDRLHRCAVANDEYELFESGHGNRRSFGDQPGVNDRCPAVNISWYDVWVFAQWCGGGLPSEAQWEYACRGFLGRRTPFNFGPGHDGQTCTADVCNFDGNYPYPNKDAAKTAGQRAYRRRTVAVDDPAFPANDWGFRHMHGNVWEWCQDWHGDSLPGGRDPVVDVGGAYRVIRGGSWNRNGWLCRAAIRIRNDPGGRSNNVGFRVFLVPSK